MSKYLRNIELLGLVVVFIISLIVLVPNDPTSFGNVARLILSAIGAALGFYLGATADRLIFKDDQRPHTILKYNPNLYPFVMARRAFMVTLGVITVQVSLWLT